jgi:hypothetical protein
MYLLPWSAPSFHIYKVASLVVVLLADYGHLDFEAHYQKRAAFLDGCPSQSYMEWYQARLFPMAFAEVITVVPVFPTWSHPYCVRAGRKFPPAGNP